MPKAAWEFDEETGYYVVRSSHDNNVVVLEGHANSIHEVQDLVAGVVKAESIAHCAGRVAIMRSARGYHGGN